MSRDDAAIYVWGFLLGACFGASLTALFFLILNA